MPVGSSFSVELIVVNAFFQKQQMQYGGQTDDKQVERTEDFGVHRVAVHLVADGELIAHRIRVEESEAAQRHAVGVFWEPCAGKSHAIMAIIHKGQFA